MNYYELSFRHCSSIDKETINDVLAGELANIGFESFSEGKEGLLAYAPENLYDKTLVDQLLAQFPLTDTKISYTEKLIEDQDWNEEWEKNYFNPIRIDKDCIIRASFHNDEPGYTYNIIIDPKMAFGTGNHETTYLMIKEMLKLELDGKELLDMGCGTAVLAILAKMRGAKRVAAIDIDKWAYDNAMDNIKLNGTKEIEVALGGAEKIADMGTFDIIFANINRNILLNDINIYAKQMHKGGTLFMSGFYSEDIPAIKEECEKNGLSLISNSELHNWVAVRAIKL